MRRPTIVLVALAAALAACGGGGGGEHPAEETVTTYLEALAEGDGEKACAQLTGEQKRRLASAFYETVPESGATTCERAVEFVAENLGEDDKDKLRDAEVAVEVDGDTARVTIEGGNETPTVTKSGDRWLISSGLFEGP